MHGRLVWLAVGLAGQVVFSLRFLVQWIQSEKRRRSVIPVVFWYLSLAGGLTLLSYAIHQKDPVFIMGQAAGVFIYTRNLQLIGRERRRSVAEPAETE